MADIQKDHNGNILQYPDFDTFLYGNATYPKIDNSMWEAATVCNTCHVGGGPDEHDRFDMRFPARQMKDMLSGKINPFTSTVYEKYDPSTGANTSTAGYAMWAYPQFNMNNPSFGQMDAPYGWSTPLAGFPNVNQATGYNFGTIEANKLMMPNVREMDCLFCHFKGYNNVMASVMVMAGSLNAVPTVGAGLLDMMPISPSYQGYASSKVRLVGKQEAFANMTSYFQGQPAGAKLVFLNSTSMVKNILAKPDQNNCMQCHTTYELKDFPQMFTGFLSSAPIFYDPDRASGPTGKRMPSFDLNAPWLQSDSPAINGLNVYNPGMTFGYGTTLGVFPMAFGPTLDNLGQYADPTFLGGANPAGTGPMYFKPLSQSQVNTGGFTGIGAAFGNQDALKKSAYPFPRAEWFKRGDAWQAGMDVHSSLGCGGCHFTDLENDNTKGGKKNQCDPGRGFDMMSGIEDGVPPLKERGLTTETFGLPDGTNSTGLNMPSQHDTRNTVKRCEFCHGSPTHPAGTDYFGKPIETFGAPNPNAKHQAYGLEGAGAARVQMVDKYELTGQPFAPDGTGGYGGQGTPSVTSFVNQPTFNPNGNHLDIIDCSVCHVANKKSMACRSLDGTSGLRMPFVIGTDTSKGMMGMFENPAPAAVNAGAVGQYNAIFTTMNSYYALTSSDTSSTGYLPIKSNSQACSDTIGYLNGTYGMSLTNADCPNLTALMGQPMMGPAYQNLIPSGTQMVGGPLQEWKPLHMWQKLGNMDLPLSLTSFNLGVTTPPAVNGMSFRRKVTLGNAITAVLWNNVAENVDANGDTVPGGEMLPTKPSLVGYKDIFTGQPLAANTTQGYGEPIFDPYIMRDLKSGMNFAPAGFDPIPVGFGTPADFGGAYMSAYTSNPGHFTGAYKYVGIWGGGIVFTEPDQISNYKAYRESHKQPNEPSWAGAQVTYYAVPFLVTHGIQPTAKFALGKSCSDCHSSQSDFFNGTMDMIGPAIPADATFNPTSQTTPVDEHGEYTRQAAVPDAYLGGPSALDTSVMQRPMEKIPRVKALATDLRTGMECFNKLGQPRTPTFEGTETTNGQTYKWTKDLQLGDVLYPDKGADYQDINGYVHHTSAAWISYLNSIGEIPLANVTVTPAPSSGTGVVNLSASPIVNDPYVIPVVAAGTPITFTAANQGSNFSYSWTFSDNTSTATGASATRTISTAKTFTATLIEKNLNTGATATKKVVVSTTLTAGAANTVHLGVINADTFSATSVPLTGMPTHTRIFVDWGDGSQNTITSSTASLTLSHRYIATGDKALKVNVMNGTSVAQSWDGTVHVAILVTPSATAGGSISPADAQAVSPGSSAGPFTATANPGYTFSTFKVDGNAVAGNPYTLTGVNVAHTIQAVFNPNITAHAGTGGTIAGPTNVPSGSKPTYIITPAVGFVVTTVKVNGSAIAGLVPDANGVVTYTFPTGVTVPQTISATFNAFSATQYAVQLLQTAGGTISGATAVDMNTASTYTITPTAGYQVDSVTVNGTPVTPTTGTLPSMTAVTYTFTVSGNSVITATYSAATTITQVAGGTIAKVDATHYTVTPDSLPNDGYLLASIRINGVPVVNGDPALGGAILPQTTAAVVTYTFATAPTTPTVITATYTPTIKVVQPAANGSITLNGTVASIAPNTGYYIAKLTVNGIDLPGQATYPFPAFTTPQLITATIAPIITVNQPANGTITIGASSVTVSAASGYQVDSVTFTNTLTGVPYAPTVIMPGVYALPTVPTSITAATSAVAAPPATYSVTTNPGTGGTITVADASTNTYMVAPAVGSHIVSVSATGAPTIDTSNMPNYETVSYGALLANQTITATFGPNITITNSGAGSTSSSVAAPGPAYGQSVTYTFTPSDVDHYVSSVKVNGVEMGGIPSYTMTANATTSIVVTYDLW